MTFKRLLAALLKRGTLEGEQHFKSGVSYQHYELDGRDKYLVRLWNGKPVYATNKDSGEDIL